MEEANANNCKKSSYLWLDELSTIEAKAAADAGTVVIFPLALLRNMASTCPSVPTASRQNT